jgi:L-fucose isomerase-like protein
LAAADAGRFRARGVSRHFPARRITMKDPMRPCTLGVIVGNRDFFPDHLVTVARADIEKLLGELGIRSVMLGAEETKLGGVETFADAQACAALFRKHAEEIDGILVVLPNFGDEKGVAETIKQSGLRVPVLVQGYPDELEKLEVATRRDAFCGKISVCNNLAQAGIPYSLTERHVVHPTDAGFRADLARFVATCRTVRGLRGARLGAVGARPAAFNTVRYSEKLLEAYGINVTTIDFSEIIAGANVLANEDPMVKKRLAAITQYANKGKTPDEKLVRMAKLAVVIGEWMEANGLVASAIQCWTSIQQNYGVNVCTVMSMMSEQMMPSACEVDVTGVLTMYAMQLAAGSPAALVDWNNNYGGDPDKCVLFHCGNWAKSFLPGITISTAPILGTVVGEENTYGALEGRTPGGALTFARISTADREGRIRGYVGNGQMTDDELKTFGTRAVAHIPNLNGLMRYVCANGFEHHVAITQSHSADVLQEAMSNYLGWDIYRHGA